MKVHQAMVRDVVSVSTTTPFRKIVELMTQHRVSGVPVVDGCGQVLGVVTGADLVVKEHRGSPVASLTPATKAHGEAEYSRRVGGAVAGELMTAPAITVNEDVDLRVAARLLSLHGIRRLPVTKEGKLVGILSRADVLKVFLRPDDDICRDIEEDILGRKMVAATPGVRVLVADGTVTVSGEVERRSTAMVIGFHVDRVDGVTRVDNELTYRIDDMQVEEDLMPPMARAELRI